MKYFGLLKVLAGGSRVPRISTGDVKEHFFHAIQSVQIVQTVQAVQIVSISR
jgi:hypothetical protein